MRPALNTLPVHSPSQSPDLKSMEERQRRFEYQWIRFRHKQCFEIESVKICHLIKQFFLCLLSDKVFFQIRYFVIGYLHLCQFFHFCFVCFKVFCARKALYLTGTCKYIKCSDDNISGKLFHFYLKGSAAEPLPRKKIRIRIRQIFLRVKLLYESHSP